MPSFAVQIAVLLSLALPAGGLVGAPRADGEPEPRADGEPEPGADGGLDATDNVEKVFELPYDGVENLFSAGTDIAFDGDTIYATQQGPSGGIHILDVSGDAIEPVGFVSCPGSQNDIAVVEPGVVALAAHSATCEDEGGEPFNGVQLIDVTDPTAPAVSGLVTGLPGGTHTLTVSPDGNVIMASPGGIANGGGVQQILDVTDRSAPFVRSTFLPNAAGCHDFTFFTGVDGRDLGVCVGLTESQVWDLEDPFDPEVLSRIVNPAIFFHHSAAITDDGRYLVIGDEAFGAHDCVGGPTGAMFLYDVSDPTLPVPKSYFGLDRTAEDTPVSTDRETWCTAHLYNFVPGTYTLVASWYSGGFNVIDWSDVTAPRETAHYRVDGDGFGSGYTNYWSAYFHEGRVYANDRGRGFEAFEVDGLDPDRGAVDMPSTGRDWAAGALLDAGIPGGPVADPARLLQLAATGQAGFACRL